MCTLTHKHTNTHKYIHTRTHACIYNMHTHRRTYCTHADTDTHTSAQHTRTYTCTFAHVLTRVNNTEGFIDSSTLAI